MKPTPTVSDRRVGLPITILLISKPAEMRFVIEIFLNYAPES